MPVSLQIVLNEAAKLSASLSLGLEYTSFERSV